jgi:integrase
MITTLKKIDGVYHARIPTPGGKSKYISTGCSTKPDAEKVLSVSSVDQLSLAAKAGRLTQKAIGQILTGKNLTCLKALELYRQRMSANRAANTVANNLRVVGNWMKDMGVESMPPSAITVSQIAGWINNPDSTWKRSMRQTALASVRTFFDFCGSQGWIVADPSRQVDLDYSVMSHDQKESPDRQPFTEDEVKHVLKALAHDWSLAQVGKHELFENSQHVLFWLFAVRAGKETGLRLSDIAQLEWRCFGESGKLVVWTEKTNKRMEHTISYALMNLVSEIPVTDAEFIFPEQRAIIRDVKKRSSLSVQFSRLLARLKIDGKSFHSLRHFKATSAYAKLDKGDLAKRLAESLTLEQIAGLLGHSNKKTTKGYLH